MRAQNTSKVQGKASCTKPNNASQAISWGLECNGQASTNVRNPDITAPTKTAGSRSKESPVFWACCTTHQFTAAAVGTKKPIKVPHGNPAKVKALELESAV